MLLNWSHKSQECTIGVEECVDGPGDLAKQHVEVEREVLQGCRRRRESGQTCFRAQGLS